jgi:3,4-dihydroxy 2-butanone 4-phosphate synthase/GTP cyclohydrolase II
MDQIIKRRVEEAIEEIGKGNVVIVADDEGRENEGDFIAAAELISPEIVNFMATHGRGLICAAVTEQRCDELQLNPMVKDNTALTNTNFTVSVDLLGNGCTTGISAHDRAKTLYALVDESTKPEDLGRPGHIFPIKAHPGGIRKRAGHTEASVELPKLAGLKPTGVLVEIMNADGSMARYPDLEKLSNDMGIKLITVQHLIDYLCFIENNE